MFKRYPWVYTFMRIGIALGIALVLSQIELDYLEAYFYDLRVRSRPVPEASGRIVTIAIDHQTIEALGRRPDANDHTQFFTVLQDAKPKAVLYLDNMESIIGSYEDLETLAHVVPPLNFYAVDDKRLPEEGLSDAFQLLPPLQDIRLRSGPKTRDTNSHARDGVTRRLVLAFQGTPLLHTEIASLENGKFTLSEYRGTFQYIRTTQGYINFRPTNTYKPISFSDILSGHIDVSTLKDKIIIIGSTSNADQEDEFIQTPYSRDTTAMSRLELHANILDTLILNEMPLRSPRWLDLLATCLIAILTVFIVMSVRPAEGLYLLGITMLAYAIFCFSFFTLGGLWLDMSHPLLAIFICYYFFIPYRLIIENRRSWEYYQKHAILTQVEELKSNFLRMMSHDLKTPIARIQGMTETLQRDIQSLSPEQKEAVKSIGLSAFELRDFVGSILNLNRIESKDIKLHLKSKDINALLQDVIQKCDYLAKQKNIKIITELEPMFSIKIDEDLMRQVFTNLIENAIKYSPENSSILITSEEKDARVIVQVADQGIGIPIEEVPNVFSKFYRAKDVRDSEIKGSGLGLYLARYFVDLHKGQIQVESEKGKGSTFSVELPMAHH
jgi:signal transduction histidine kinase